MATATLLNYELEEGQRLLDALNLAGLLTDSALWIYSSDSASCRYYPFFAKLNQN